ncbi:MAG TPA: ABC transporter permease [Thermoanaerobaculia bacterium]|nr:ABC transporter permease [Thermoanaerobaculia bacterium]
MKTYLLEIKYEFLKALRMPGYSLPTLLFPLFFYLFFGVLFGAKHTGGVNMATYLVATYGTFGVMGAALFGFGVSVAVERGQGWLEVKRTTPMPMASYFVSKLAMAMIFSAIIVTALFILGSTMGHAQITLPQMLTMFGVLVLGSITFCMLGLAIGFWAGPNSATPIVNLIYLPMGFLAGLWIPIVFLPQSVQNVAQWLPAYHFSQLALRTIGASRGDTLAYNIVAMLAATLFFAVVAWIGYRRDEGKLYG